ncbi:hypothetical protein DT037_08280 [Pseudomonas fulva]|nr:hypothetical protein [Pseudomonas fulva]
MDGQRAVFERATLSQQMLLFRRLDRSKASNHMTEGLGCGSALKPANPLPRGLRRQVGQIGLGQSMNRCSTAKRRAR